MAGYENLAGFRPGPGHDMISGATLLHSCDVLLRDMFLVFFLDNFKNDCVLWTLFLSTTEATKSVWKAFENYVTV